MERKYTGAFFESLGQYVYQYINEDGEVYYTGKGNKGRCISHVVDKGFDSEECYIVARNLELFESKNDWQSFLLESYLIQRDQPTSNSVSGHYKECFTMKKLSEFLTDFENAQYDNYESLPDWYVGNYDILRPIIRELRINRESTKITLIGRSGMYTAAVVPIKPEDGIEIIFEISTNMTGGLERSESVIEWLQSNGYNPVQDEARKHVVLRLTLNSTEEMFELFSAMFD